MNTPEDDIPLPSEGVLSEAETTRQLRENMCREFKSELARSLDREDRLKRAIHAAHGLIAPLGNQPVPSVLVIREALDILRRAL